MNGYTKLFGDIITSTIWQEPNDCRVLWITMLALKDRNHICRATVPCLAKMAGIANEQCEEYLAKFQAPDKYSRSQEHGGRRIEKADDGWYILNGPKYRDKLNAEDRKEQVRRNVAAHRERQKKGGTVRAAGTKPKNGFKKIPKDENGFGPPRKPLDIPPPERKDDPLEPPEGDGI